MRTISGGERTGIGATEVQAATIVPAGVEHLDDWSDVDRAHTHKRYDEAVLVRRTRRLSVQEMSFELRKPVGAERELSMAISEWTRQIVIACAHHYFDVPLGWAFVMRRLKVRIEETGAQDGRVPDADIAVSRIVERSGALRSLDARVTFRIGGRIVARGFGDLQVLPPAVYARMRGHAPISSGLEPAPPGSAALSVVATGSGIWQIGFDPHDPFFFDHPLDHVPGMLLVAALRTVALRESRVAADDLRSFDGVFCRFAELDEPLNVHVTAHAVRSDEDAFEMEIRTPRAQTVATATVHARSRSPREPVTAVRAPAGV